MQKWMRCIQTFANAIGEKVNPPQGPAETEGIETVFKVADTPAEAVDTLAEDGGHPRAGQPTTGHHGCPRSPG